MRATFTVGLLVTIAGLWLTSCSSMIPVDEPSGTDHRRFRSVITLPFVTNRRLEADENGARRFGTGHGDLSAGRCVVGFEGKGWRGELIGVETAPLDAVLPDHETDPLVLYVHGYSESFSRSCRRAALLQERLGLDGRLLLFSWPSRNYLTYEQDADELAASVDRLNELLSLAAARVGYDSLVILAHSMGSRGVVEALDRRDEDPARFASIVMIAPDISRRVFLENVPMLQARASDITVYMSDNDRVLWLSTTVNVSGRLGNASELPVATEELSFVDITPTGTTYIGGHLYHLHNPAVIEDLRALFGTDPPNTERRSRREPTDSAGIWKLVEESN
jgi:pimeloyl-ACP methyl ester carboxylesterase